MTWIRHTDNLGAFYNSLKRPDGVVIYADVWPVEGGYLWAVGADGREWRRGARPAPTLLEAQRRGVMAMERLEDLYRRKP